MNNGQPVWAELSTGLQVALGLLVLLQLGLQITALVSLVRTPAERLQTGKRWVWLLVVLLGGLVGSIVYLAVGRRPPQAEDPVLSGSQKGPTPDRSGEAAKVLYGDPDERDETDEQGNRP